MNKEKLKEELHKLIDNIDDESILNIMKEDFAEYQTKEKQIDDLRYLSATDLAELEELSKESPEKNSVSFEEYQKIMKERSGKL